MLVSYHGLSPSSASTAGTVRTGITGRSELITSQVAKVARSPIDVFLIAGQSNVAGAIDTPDRRPDVPSGKTWQYNGTNGGWGIYDLACFVMLLTRIPRIEQRF